MYHKPCCLCNFYGLTVVILCFATMVLVFIGLITLSNRYAATGAIQTDVVISNNLPICRDNTLFHMNKADQTLLTTTDGDNSVLQPQCLLHHYVLEDVVKCLDELSFRRAQHKEPVQIAFVGDSIIRNQFKSLLRLIPDYDMEGKKKSTFLPQYQWYEDRQVISKLLNLRVSFYWRHLANEKLLKTFRDWSMPPYKNTPDYIVMGQSDSLYCGLLTHHINLKKTTSSHTSFELFSRGLEELKTIAKQLMTNNRTRIVWMIQAPGPNRARPYFSAQIPRYNARAKYILKDSGIAIWDSQDQLGIEYSRGCAENGRNQSYLWHRCTDPNHHGFVMLQHSTQVLLNDVCNNLILQPIRVLTDEQR